MVALSALVSGLDAEMTRLGYKDSTMAWYRGCWCRLQRYFAAREAEEFSLDLAMACGPRVDCGSGHQAAFVSYREKTIDTALGPVTVRRAWYHCATCGHGLAPRDAELAVAGASSDVRALRDFAQPSYRPVTVQSPTKLAHTRGPAARRRRGAPRG